MFIRRFEPAWKHNWTLKTIAMFEHGTHITGHRISSSLLFSWCGHWNSFLCLSHIQPRAPYDFYHPYDFLPVRPSEAPVGILRRCCSRSHVRLDTAVYLWFGWIIRMTPRVPRAGIVRAPYGNLQCFSYPTGPVRGPCGTRKGAVRRPYGHARDLTQPELAKIPHGRRILPYGSRTGPVRFPHELFTGCLKSLNPYGARKLIMHALKLYGPRTRRQNSYGAARGPCGPREWTYDFCSKQPVNSPGTARTGPGSVMWLRH